MTFTIRPITENERPEFRRLMGLAFGFDPTDEGTESFNATLEIERTICAFDGEQMIGTAGAYSLDMTGPGGAAPGAGTTAMRWPGFGRRRARSTVDSGLERPPPWLKPRSTEATPGSADLPWVLAPCAWWNWTRRNGCYPPRTTRTAICDPGWSLEPGRT